jgi:prepilin-type processing-associated H-X9-DG protein
MTDDGRATGSPEPGKPNIRAALFWTTVLSIVLAPLVIVGPFIAGYVGGRKARAAPAAFIAALGPALIWVAVWWWISAAGIPVGKERIYPPVDMFSPTTGLAILAGALAGSGGGLSHLIGAAAVVFALGWFGRGASGFYRTYKHLMYKPAGDDVQVRAADRTCTDRLKKLYAATMLYAEAWDGQLPPAENWMAALRDPSQSFGEEEDLHCPEVPAGGPTKYGYAMNRAVSGKRVDEIEGKEKTPLFFDSDDLSHNASAPSPVTTRHGGKSNVVYADGRVGQQ